MRRETRRGLILGGVAGGGAILLGKFVKDRDALPPLVYYPPESLVVAVVNVGMGEASWIKTPSGQFIVFGVGPEESAEPLVRSLRQAGATRIDLLILPTPYRESLGGVPGLCSAFPVLQTFDNGWPEILNGSHRAARETLERLRIPIYAARAGQSFPLGQGVAEILHPAELPVEASPEAGNNSVVLRLRWAATTFLWAGGLERSGEEALLHRVDGISAQWLRVARFGTGHATSAEWLREVAPEIAVISCGPNSSGYPDAETLSRIEASGARIFRTEAVPDALVFLSDGSSIVRAD